MAPFDQKNRKFTEVYSDLYPLVYSITYSRIGNIEDVKDICHEVFIRFFDKYAEVQNPRKWILGTLRNTVMEFYRKNRRDEIDIDELFNDIGLTFVNGFRDTRLIIEEALESDANFTDGRERVLFDLVAVHNFTYKEVGKHLGLTERQVRYKYSELTHRIVHYLIKKGVRNIEDLL
jgi:RNA polymerase sigma-70 factor (ECF subfamily)